MEFDEDLDMNMYPPNVEVEPKYEDICSDSDGSSDAGDYNWNDLQEISNQDRYLYEQAQKAKHRYHQTAQRDREFWSANRELMRRRYCMTNS